MSEHRLSKSSFVAGWQCHKYLWLRTHEKDATELKPDDALQAVFDRGHLIGELARSYFPGGVLIDFPYNQIPNKLAATQEALENGATVIYEAAFQADDVFCAVDILEKDGDSWNLIEVKSTTKAKHEHLPDVGIQTHVLEQCGIKINRAELMHLNRECRYPDLSNLFARTDMTDDVRKLLPLVEKRVAKQLEMLQGPCPEIEVGPHCKDPRECPFYGRCWPELPEHHVSSLYRIGQSWPDLVKKGYETIYDLPEFYPLSKIAMRQQRAVQSGDMVLEDGLATELSRWKPPLAFLDFETVQPVIPVWDGCRPYDQVAVQFSCHILKEDGTLTHHEWLADGPDDQREEIVAELVEVLQGVDRILAYNASFEKRCLLEIRDAFFDLSTTINNIVHRIDDLLPVVRNLTYHPQYHGSFSIKSVLPALLPGMGYADLAISDGRAASNALEALLLHGDAIPAEEKEKVRENLLAYCRMDTLAMIRLYEKLQELAK